MFVKDLTCQWERANIAIRRRGAAGFGAGRTKLAGNYYSDATKMKHFVPEGTFERRQ